MAKLMRSPWENPQNLRINAEDVQDAKVFTCLVSCLPSKFNQLLPCLLLQLRELMRKASGVVDAALRHLLAGLGSTAVELDR